MAAVYRLLGGVSGATAVGAGAYGAHAFKPDKPAFKEVFDTANRYHLVHSALIALAPAASARPHLVGGLFAGGTLLFCGSCYAVAVAQDRALGKAAPVGGTLLIAAWLATALA